MAALTEKDKLQSPGYFKVIKVNTFKPTDPFNLTIILANEDGVIKMSSNKIPRIPNISWIKDEYGIFNAIISDLEIDKVLQYINKIKKNPNIKKSVPRSKPSKSKPLEAIEEEDEKFITMGDLFEGIDEPISTEQFKIKIGNETINIRLYINQRGECWMASDKKFQIDGLRTLVWQNTKGLFETDVGNNAIDIDSVRTGLDWGVISLEKNDEEIPLPILRSTPLIKPKPGGRRSRRKKRKTRSI